MHDWEYIPFQVWKKNSKCFIRLSKTDLDYGIPTNEKTLKRGIEANRLINQEVEELCEVDFFQI